MGKQDVIEIDGEVVDTLPNAMFKVKLANGHEILACTTSAFYQVIVSPLRFHLMI